MPKKNLPWRALFASSLLFSLLSCRGDGSSPGETAGGTAPGSGSDAVEAADDLSAEEREAADTTVSDDESAEELALVVDAAAKTSPLARVSIASPANYRVYQRQGNNAAVATVSGRLLSKNFKTLHMTIVRESDGSTLFKWKQLAVNKLLRFTANVRLPAGGWYRAHLKVQGSNGQSLTMSTGVFGVGEVFVTAGQSNSTNSASHRTSEGTYGPLPQQVEVDPATNTFRRVVAWDGAKWRIAHDPQPQPANALPTATGEKDPAPPRTGDGSKGGSTWALLGNQLESELHVPVAFISVGWGGTAIEQWQKTSTMAQTKFPGTTNGYLNRRLGWVLKAFGKNGVRAVLWHQGEANTFFLNRMGVKETAAVTYANNLRQLIMDSRAAAGFVVPWFVSTVSYPGDFYEDPTGHKVDAEKAVRDGQQRAIANTAGVFAGIDTDSLTGATEPDGFRSSYDGIHLSKRGLDEASHRWLEVLRNSGMLPR